MRIVEKGICLILSQALLGASYIYKHLLTRIDFDMIDMICNLDRKSLEFFPLLCYIRHSNLNESNNKI